VQSQDVPCHKGQVHRPLLQHSITIVTITIITTAATEKLVHLPTSASNRIPKFLFKI
jgi:hypothetical protein